MENNYIKEIERLLDLIDNVENESLKKNIINQLMKIIKDYQKITK